MSRLKTTVILSFAMLGIGLGNAQAAANRFHFLDFHMFKGQWSIAQMVDPDRREPAIDLNGDDDNGGGIQPGIKPDDSRSFSAHYAEPGDWTAHQQDMPDSGWHTETDSNETKWTMQTDTP